MQPTEAQPLFFQESALAHALLDGKRGLEIGASAHNPFGLNTINVDITDSMETTHKLEEIKLCGKAAKVDVVAPGDKLPFAPGLFDFVVASHVIEHFWNPLAALREWLRVVKPGGLVFLIIPHRDRTFDKGRELTTIAELNARDAGTSPAPDVKGTDAHHCVWDTRSFVIQMGMLSRMLGCRTLQVRDVDDKVGNGFTVVLKKT